MMAILRFSKKTPMTNRTIRETISQEFGNVTEKQILIEILVKLEQGNRLANRNRSNTSMMVTWLVVIPIIFSAKFILLVLMGHTLADADNALSALKCACVRTMDSGKVGRNCRVIPECKPRSTCLAPLEAVQFLLYDGFQFFCPLNHIWNKPFKSKFQ